MKVAKEFLEGHPEESKKLGFRVSMEAPVGANYISKFLSWAESKVTYSLECLRLMGEIEGKKVLESHSEEIRNILKSTMDDFKRARIGAPVISQFLGKWWSESKVAYSLERLRLWCMGQ